MSRDTVRQMAMGNGLDVIHTDWEVGNAIEEAMAPVTKPVTQNRQSHCVPIASAYSHGRGGLSSE